MANPRKFSEKIALHNQKQAEETAEFERIMREVSDVTSKGDEATNLTELKSYTTLENVKPKKDSVSKAGNPNHSRESRGRTPGGPMRNRQSSRNHDTSPYGNSSVHLIPPMESNWHRSISDSAIHQSLCQAQSESNHLNTHSPLTLSPTVQRKISNAQSISKVHHHHNLSSNHLENNTLHDMRSRSSTGLSRLPGINIYPSQNHNDGIQIPIPSNTGSLPDLTSVGYPMYPSPLDQEYDHNAQNSSYCPSPLGTSPSSLSPTSAIHTNHHPHPRPTNFGGGPGGGGGGGGYPIPTSSHPSSGNVSPSNNHHHNNNNNNNSTSTTNLNNAVNNGSSSTNHNNVKNNNKKPKASQPFLSVPDSNRFTLFSKGNNTYDVSQSPQPQQTPQQQQQQQQRIPTLEQLNYENFTQLNDGLSSPNQQNSPENILYGSHGNMSPHMMLDYRSRPSPGSSPGLVIAHNFDSNSSAPCSPVSTSIGSNNGPTYDKYPSNEGYVSHLPQHLEHITLVDNPLQQDYSSSQIVFETFEESYLALNNDLNLRTDTTHQQQQHHQQHQQQQQQTQQHPPPQQSPHCGQLSNNVANSLANHSYSHQNGSNEPLLSLQTAPQIQSTTIPEIVFTDFSTRDDFESDLALGQMDFQSFQMLSDTAGPIIDPMDEDSFRRELQ